MTAVLNRVSPHSNSRLASLRSFLPLFPFHRSNRTFQRSRIPLSIRFVPSSFSSRFSYKGRGRGRKATKFGIENYWEGSHRERCPCLSCCPYVYLPFINSRSDNFFSKLRDSATCHARRHVHRVYICSNQRLSLHTRERER